jgi:hypothetical protein
MGTMASLISGVHRVGAVATATDRAAARVRRGLLLALAAALALALGAIPAGAVPLVKTGTFASAGSGAGQVSEPQGVAVDQATGDVYVADRRNHRVDKFDAQGNFILAFGREVEIADEGQTSKLLTRLARLDLLVNEGGAPGAPNAWRLTAKGQQLLHSIPAR